MIEPNDRRTPEEFLEAIQIEESQRNKGKLKIFLGMAAGVGKTYAMLEEAQQLRKEGIDLIVGTVDTHNRAETALLLTDLKCIPLQTINYKGIELKELDLKAIFDLSPDLVIVDELAHSNAPGSTHAKRWQDVMEILDNGIDVYTTLNVQHIESLNDIVKEITEVSVRETVPDLIIEKASSIRLIDITPDELLQRLREGKVYLEDQSRIASQHFFVKDKLTALREIVLRYTAEKVDRDLRGMAPITQNPFELRLREKFLVAISYNPLSQKLIRVTRRLAASINAPWIAAYVYTGQFFNDKENDLLAKNFSLARDLGAEIVTINSPSIGEGIERIARQRGVTQIILGRPPQNLFTKLFKGYDLLDSLINKCKDIDIHIIRQERFSVTYHKSFFSFSFHIKISDYIYASLCIALLSAISWFILPMIGYKLIGVLFLLGILLLSLFFKKGPLFFAAVLYAVIWNFFFIPPPGVFKNASNEDLALILLYILTATFTGILVDRTREHKEMLAKSEESTRALYEIARQIAISPSTNNMLKSVKEHLDRTLKGLGTINFLIKSIDDGIDMDKATALLPTDQEKNAALWAFENGKEAGWSTDTLPLAKQLYIPLKGFTEVVGLLIYQPKSNRTLNIEERNFLNAICQQLSSYFERSFGEERAVQHEHLKHIDNIHTIILTRISQVFERPVLNTRKSMNKLKTYLESSNNKEIINEINEINTSFEAFVKIIANISAMTQLSEGMVPLRVSSQHIREIIEECCSSAEKLSGNKKIKIHIHEKLPIVSFDYYLIEILIHNLILNAIQHSPENGVIEVEAKEGNGFIIISVLDEGKGIPPDHLQVIFEKFYRLPDDTSPGIGLGLAIAKTIAEIHRGYLKAENHPSKGAKFSLFLPIEVPTSLNG